MSWSRLSVLFTLAASAGCEWKVTSRVGVQVMAPLVRAHDDGTRDAPVAGAPVRVECPDGKVERLGTTDAFGWVLVNTRTPVGMDCSIAILRGGHVAAQVPINEACSSREGGECRAFEARVVLDLRLEAREAQPRIVRLGPGPAQEADGRHAELKR
ncbi:MAG TPA: hypothetical protein VFE90_02230 [Myxococcales bacterium]|jgi:hypothetical protein|nr:hypothetical protein [Myxococcales bacterium]